MGENPATFCFDAPSTPIMSNPKAIHGVDSIDCARVSSTGSSAELYNLGCPRCYYLEQQLCLLLKNHGLKQRELQQCVVEAEDEVRRYTSEAEDKMHKMQTAINQKQEELIRLRIRLEEVVGRTTRELAGKDKLVLQLQKHVDEMKAGQQQTPRSSQLFESPLSRTPKYRS